MIIDSNLKVVTKNISFFTDFARLRNQPFIDPNTTPPNQLASRDSILNIPIFPLNGNNLSGNALVYDGVDDYTQVTNINTNLVGKSAFTVTLVAKRDRNNRLEFLFSLSTTDNTQGRFSVQFTASNQIATGIRTINDETIRSLTTSSTSFNSTTQTYIISVGFDLVAQKIRIWVNGNLEASADAVPFSNTTIIGATVLLSSLGMLFNNSNYFKGNIYALITNDFLFENEDAQQNFDAFKNRYV